jgi:SEFIR domain
LPDDLGTVFISYTHDSPDHLRAVLSLSNRLRSEGIDCVLDQYESSPPEGWPQWTDREIKKAQFVLIICTEAYHRRMTGEETPGIGLGATWEGTLICTHIYSAGSRNTKFIPIVFDQEHVKYIPTPIQNTTRYCVSTDYEQLYSRLIGKPPADKPPLGKRKALPEREVKTDFDAPSSTPHRPYLAVLSHLGKRACPGRK